MVELEKVCQQQVLQGSMCYCQFSDRFQFSNRALETMPVKAPLGRSHHLTGTVADSDGLSAAIVWRASGSRSRHRNASPNRHTRLNPYLGFPFFFSRPGGLVYRLAY